MARLILPDAGTQFEITKAETVIGRGPDCDIVLGSRTANRRHARLLRKGEMFVLEDLDSRNGTFLNGARVNEGAELRDGDRIAIGDEVLVFQLEGAAASSEPPAAAAEPKPPRRVRRVRGGPKPVTLPPLTSEPPPLSPELLEEAVAEPPLAGSGSASVPTRGAAVRAVDAPASASEAAAPRRAAVSGCMPPSSPEPASRTPRPASASCPPAEARGDFGADSSAARDEVDCTVFSPPLLLVGGSLMVQVFVHQPEAEQRVREAAREFDSDATRRGVTSLGTEIARGTRLTFDLEISELVVDRPRRDLVWRGKAASVQFRVEVPASVAPQDIHATLYVSQEGIPIGDVVFKLKLVSLPPDAAADNAPTGQATRYQQAFISYARSDTREVSRRVQMLAAAGVKYFQDVFSLQPGQQWLPAIQAAIDESDVVFLFWSSAAKTSDWVQKEWRYALQKKGAGCIRPVTIEGPPIPDPPGELAHLHFGDPIMHSGGASIGRRLFGWLWRLGK